MRIQLITDSTCDLTREALEQRGILFEPLKVLFGTDEYADKVDLDATAFYQKMKASPILPTTSQVNPGAFEQLFLQVLERGEEIVGIFLSSDLSGTFSAASIAKAQIEEQYPHYAQRITLLDSRTTSFGLGLLVLELQELINAGLSRPEIAARMATAIEKQQLYGLLHNLDNLVKGGRLSAGSAFIGNLLNVKPIIEVHEGKVQVASKARGTKKGLQWMVDQLLTAYPDRKVPVLAYAHANNLEKLQELQHLVESNFTVQNSYILEIGPVVGTHVGEDAVGLAYFKP